MTPPTTLGLIVPLGTAAETAPVTRLLEERVVESVWVRDLPAVDVGDDDTGQGADPWWYLGRLRGAGPPPGPVGSAVLGTASVILGVRHPRVLARAAAGAQIDTGGRFVLGVGTGGKPAMNGALGVAGRSYADFAAQWADLRAALRGLTEGAVSLRLPPDFAPPPVLLATSDLQRWRAIEGDADGWQTFLTDDRAGFDRAYADVAAIRGAETPVDLRLDAELVPTDRAGRTPGFTAPERGRVRCSADQLPGLVRPWLGEPVRRILLRAHGHEPERAVRRLSADWPSLSASVRPSR